MVVKPLAEYPFDSDHLHAAMCYRDAVAREILIAGKLRLVFSFIRGLFSILLDCGWLFILKSVNESKCVLKVLLQDVGKVEQEILIDLEFENPKIKTLF